MASPLNGRLRVPSDKSLSHRVALFSAMAEGTSNFLNLLDSLDVRSTLAAIEVLGAKVELDEDNDKNGLCGRITGWGSTGPKLSDSERLGSDDPAETIGSGNKLQCGNSGTTARLLLGVLGGYDITVTLEGDDSLSRRPMSRVTDPLSLMGANFEPSAHLPIKVIGCKELTAITYESLVASAQVKSAILLAGINANGITTVSEPHKSRDHTELMLPAFGAKLEVYENQVSIEGGQQLKACDCSVPADPSSAAFLLVSAAMIPGSEILVEDVLLNPTRGGFLLVMQRMGVDIAVNENPDASIGAEVCGDITVKYNERLVATTVEAHEIASLIDEIPILALLAATAKGETVFKQVSELRVKESDRLLAIINGLKALGIEAWTNDDDLHIVGGEIQPCAQVFETHGDHRLAMTWSIASRAFDLNLNIADIECVAVSYPGFFADLIRLS